MNFPPPSVRQARLLWGALTALAIAILLVLMGAFLWAAGVVVKQLSSVLVPLAIAGVIAYLLDPIVDWLEERGLPRARAIICVFALALVIVGGLIGSVVPQIINETTVLAERIPGYAARLQNRVRAWLAQPPTPLRRFLMWRGQQTVQTNLPPATDLPPDLTLTNTAPTTNAAPSGASLWSQALDPGALQSAASWAAKSVPKIGSWLLDQVTRVASWFGVLAGLLLIPVYAFYLLLEKRGIEGNWKAYLPIANSELKDELIFVLSSINECLISFFRGQVLVAICDAMLYTAGFYAIGLPYAFLLGAMAMFLTMIPFLGAVVIWFIATIIAFVQFLDWLHPLLVLAVFGVVQLLEGLVISPKIMGDRVGLHPLTIIIAVMVGTSLMGNILGGILAIPLTAALRAVMFRYVWKVREATPAAFARRI